MDRIETMADKAEIVDVMSRYCYAVDFRNMEQLRDVFTTDAQAVYVLSPLGLEDVHLSGVDEIIGWLDSVLRNPVSRRPGTRMTNHLVEIDGDRARSRATWAAARGSTPSSTCARSDGWRADLEMCATSRAGVT
jgi:hypothetical protein